MQKPACDVYNRCLFIIAKLEATKKPFDTRIDKQTLAPPYCEILFTDKKKQASKISV